MMRCDGRFKWDAHFVCVFDVFDGYHVPCLLYNVLCVVVVTYKKTKVTNKNVLTNNNKRRNEEEEDVEDNDGDLTSGQFGITDPEDEGK